MTHDEILKLEANPETDALIAKKVMGWKIGKMGINAGFWVDATGKEMHVYTWSPTTDISAAWEVVEKLSVDGTQFYICTNFSGMNDEKFYVTIGRDILESFSVYESFADTAPLAICRAALLTVMEIKDVPQS